MVQCTWDPNALWTTTTVQDSPPPTYSSVAECSELTMAHFRFPREASSLLEQNGCRIEVCEHVHAALQLESQYWVLAFVRAGVPLSIALDLQDIFENEAIYQEVNDELEHRATSESPAGDESDSDMTFDNFIDLTLDSDS